MRQPLRSTPFNQQPESFMTPDLTPDSSPGNAPHRRPALEDIPVIVATLAALVFVAIVQVARGGVYFSQWLGDIFIPLGGVAHMRVGQWPHRDFVTPVGSLWYAINYLPTLVMPMCARVVIWANLIVALFAGLGTLGVCLGRMPRWLASLASFYVGMVALSPRQIGEAFTHISNNASYNRYCWALICVVALASLLPSREGGARRRDIADGLVAGLLIAMCFYIKVTYAAAGFGFIGAALLTTRRRGGGRFAMLAGSAAIGTIAVVGALTGELPGYFADMATAVAVLPHTARTVQALNQLGFSLPGLLLVSMVARFANAQPGKVLGPFSPGVWAGVLTVLAGFAIQVQNHPEPENPLLPVALIIGWTASRHYAQGTLRFSRPMGHAILGLFLAIVLASDLCAVGWTALAPGL